ncbi:MAG: peroxide stress protein YaaA [Flavobacteriaceae bacterium]|nr:peroxide stress protein YaaA [Flavobacteriaceae bacterium]
MKLVLSPAKSLDYESSLPTTRGTQPRFLEDAEQLNKALERKSKKALGDLMDISKNLVELNYQRYKDFETPFTKQNARPAIYAFSGDVYQGFDAYTLPTSKLDTLQDTVRILSGMYGVLRPLDLMQPYRLEMGTSLKVQRKNNLYEFWGDRVTESLNAEMDEDETLLNLASQEYFKVINTKKIKAKVISPVFKDFKNGELKIISFFAKKARGSMARYVVDNNTQTLRGLKGFDYDGYAFSEAHTEKEDQPVFIR